MFQRYHRGQDALRLIEGLTVRKHTEGSVMASASLARRAGVLLVGSPGVPGGQDARTIRLLRLGVGAIGIGLPLALIAGNWLTGDKAGAKVIVPDSMSGSYYTSMRNMFVGALCALGVFLIFYRHTERQDRCTLFAGVCALLVAFDPTAAAHDPWAVQGVGHDDLASGQTRRPGQHLSWGRLRHLCFWWPGLVHRPVAHQLEHRLAIVLLVRGCLCIRVRDSLARSRHPRGAHRHAAG